MNINFFDDPNETPRMREDVRIERLRLEVSPEAQRLAVDLELTPFIERPTVELYLANERGEKAGLLTIIETLDRTISVVMHLRDPQPADSYTLRAQIYYSSVETDISRQVVDTVRQDFRREPGSVTFFTADSSNQD